jgi:predicted dehydrogenase
LFDAARFVLGPIEAASGFTINIPRQAIDNRTGKALEVTTDDLAAAWFEHENGVAGHIFLSRITPRFAANGQLEVVGTEGALRAGLSRGKFESLQSSTPAQPDWTDIPLPDAAYAHEPHALGAMMRSFVDACAQGSVDPDRDATFEDGLAAQLAMEAVLEGHRTGRQIRLADLGG